MKRLLAMLLLMAMGFSGNVMAEEVKPKQVMHKEEVSAVPVLYSDEEESAEPVLISEEIMDHGIAPELIGAMRNAGFSGCAVKVLEEEIDFDTKSQVKDGVLYLPLRHTLEKLGYEIVWNQENRSIDIIDGAGFTTVYLGKNFYFKNKMAPIELSGAPYVTMGRTMVPVEFFWLILDESMVIDSNDVIFNQDAMAVHTGFVQIVDYDETGNARIILSTHEISKSIGDQTIIHTNSDFTVFQKDIVEGETINVLSSPMMALSIPGQTAGYVIY